MNRRRRSLALLTVAALSSVVANTLEAGPSFATSVTSNYDTATFTGTLGPAAPGNALTTTQMIARAHDWINTPGGIPYTQSAGWEDSSTGGPYRQDCSGFISMAWGLKNSLVTSTLPNVSTVTSTNIYGDTNLAPGDALDYTADHVVLFDSWVSKSAGTFSYDAEHDFGQVADQRQGSVYASTLEGFSLSSFEALRYNNTVSADPSVVATSQVGTGGNFDLFYVVNGQVKYRTGSASGWLGLANVPNAPTGVTGLATVQLGTTGQFDLIYNVGGTLKYQTGKADGSGPGHGNVPNAPTGVNDVTSVQLGTTGQFDAIYNVGGTLKYQTGGSNGSWLGVADVPNALTGVNDVTSVQLGTTGQFDLIYTVAGAVKFQTGGSNGSWLGVADVPNAPTGVSTVASVPLGTTGQFDVFYDASGTLMYQTGASNGSWLGTADVPTT